MEDSLKKKVRKRSGHKLFVKNVLSSYGDFLPEEGRDLSGLSKNKLESYRRTLNKQKLELDTLNNEIFDLLPKEAVEKETQEKLEFESEIEDALCIIEGAIGSFSLKDGQSIGNENFNTSSASSAETTGAFKQQAKLQKLSMPTFDGKVENWPSFYDIFESAVHCDPHLSNVTKFQYLQSLLKGVAKEAIAGLKVTNANYESALQILKERFGQKQILITTHVTTLVSLSPVESCSDLKNLRTLYDKTESVVRSLDGLGITEENYGTFLTPVLLGKLPNELKITISRRLGNGNWDLKRLLDTFKEELMIRENCFLMPNDGRKRLPRVSPYREREERQPTVSTLYTSGNRVAKPNCVFCKGDHPSQKCQTVTKPSTRRRILMQNGRCFMCFKTGHIAVNCLSNIKCYTCGGKHHVTICSAEKSPTKGGPVAVEKRREIPPPVVGDMQYQPSEHSVHLEQGMSQNILLQTARAKVSSPQNENTTANVRILLDSGAQRTYISYKLRDKLALPTKAFLNVSIKPDERDFLRFLWVNDISDSDKLEIVCFRFTRLVFGLVSSPFVLNATIRAHLAKYAQSNEKFVRNVLNCLYVDDFISTFSSKTEALESYKELKLCFKRGGFNLRKWESNCCELADEIGLAWDKTSDRIRFDFSKIFSNDCQFVTKREILSSTAKIYDPLGLLSPIVVPLKLLFQELCKKKVNWDTKLSEEISTEWRTIVSDIQSSPPVFVNRSVTDVNKDEIDHVELHGFSDASSIAFGAAVYIRVVKKSGKISVDLVAAKTRLVPLKSDTIPRLELMAALEDIETNDLTVEEVENARISWLRVIQSHLSSERNFDKNLVYLRVYEDENGRRLIDAPNVETYAEYDSSKTKLTHRQSHLKSLLKHFWNRWSSEYLLTLREFHKNKGKTGARIVAVGDVVVILNDKVKRQQWKLGKILKVYPGKDNIVRAADVKTTDSAGRSIILKRSITHLYPLEVREDSEKDYGIAAAAEPAVSEVFDVPIRFIADEEAEELIN
eukprot:gene11404-21602_t